MKYEVFLSVEAEIDFFNICSYLEDHVSPNSFVRLFEGLKKTFLTLEEFPERGHCPPELERINVEGYSEIHFRPYRIIYRIIGSNVYIQAVLDGRRNLEVVLFDRILKNL
jgi:toxin ParE1/3/4